jgi:hypothetical protein
MPTVDTKVSGLVGTIGCTILHYDGTVHAARATAGITEPVAGSGTYHIADPDPATTLTFVWDIVAGTGSASETLYAGRQSVPDILADTNELQAELADGGRTDLILDGISGLEKLARNRVDTDPATGVMTVYDDNSTTPLYTADVFEDVAGTIPYDGQAANRRDRLA